MPPSLLIALKLLGHGVESSRQLANLVPGMDLDTMREVALSYYLRRLSQTLKGSHQLTRQKEAEHNPDSSRQQRGQP